MKDKNIKIIEEIRRGQTGYMDVKFTILMSGEGLEVNTWEHNVKISENELALTQVKMLTEKIKLENALKTFEAFYIDNFIKV